MTDIRYDKGVPCGEGFIPQHKTCRAGKGVSSPARRRKNASKIAKKAAIAVGATLAGGAAVGGGAYLLSKNKQRTEQAKLEEEKTKLETEKVKKKSEWKKKATYAAAAGAAAGAGFYGANQQKNRSQRSGQDQQQNAQGQQQNAQGQQRTKQGGSSQSSSPKSKFAEAYDFFGIDSKNPPSRDEWKQMKRKMAKQYHPDLNPNDPDATSKFQEFGSRADLIERLLKYDSSLVEYYVSVLDRYYADSCDFADAGIYVDMFTLAG